MRMHGRDLKHERLSLRLRLAVHQDRPRNARWRAPDGLLLDSCTGESAVQSCSLQQACPPGFRRRADVRGRRCSAGESACLRTPAAHLHGVDSNRNPAWDRLHVLRTSQRAVTARVGAGSAGAVVLGPQRAPLPRAPAARGGPDAPPAGAVRRPSGAGRLDAVAGRRERTGLARSACGPCLPIMLRQQSSGICFYALRTRCMLSVWQHEKLPKG